MFESPRARHFFGFQSIPVPFCGCLHETPENEEMCRMEQTRPRLFAGASVWEARLPSLSILERPP